MRIEKLVLENFRGFRSSSLCFDKKLTVFSGVNGAGKTNLLDTMAKMLSWVVSRTGSVNSAGQRIREDDITNGESLSKLEMICSNEGTQIYWRLVGVRKGHPKPEEKSMFEEINQYAHATQVLIANSKENVNLPLFVYYPVNRNVDTISLKVNNKHKFGILEAYRNSLDSRTDSKMFFEWFRKREDLENEIWRDHQSLFADKTREYPDPQIEAVRKAIYSVMPEFSELTVHRNPLNLYVHKAGKRVKVDQLSGGEKNLLAMIGDLARRLSMANPTLKNSLEGEGIVLIDEIDLHLHPKWQRMIVPQLLSVFPNCQFVISTHSPNVINQVLPESLILLEQNDDGFGCRQVAESYGMSIERVVMS